VIGYGGGSSLDLGKAVAALVPNGGDPMAFLEVIGAGKKLEKPSLPFIAIPTTAGNLRVVDLAARPVSSLLRLRLRGWGCFRMQALEQR
jgi:hypothetical protein